MYSVKKPRPILKPAIEIIGKVQRVQKIVKIPVKVLKPKTEALLILFWPEKPNLIIPANVMPAPKLKIKENIMFEEVKAAPILHILPVEPTKVAII